MGEGFVAGVAMGGVYAKLMTGSRLPERIEGGANLSDVNIPAPGNGGALLSAFKGFRMTYLGSRMGWGLRTGRGRVRSRAPPRECMGCGVIR